MVDYALFKFTLQEPDYRALVHDHELLENEEVQSKFANVAEHIENLLNFEPEETTGTGEGENETVIALVNESEEKVADS